MSYNTIEKKRDFQQRYRLVNKDYREHNRLYMQERRKDPIFVEEQRIKNRERMREISNQYKELAKKRFGFKCYVCGNTLNWDFFTIIHHRDGSNEHKGSALNHPQSWDKCVVLCKLCHRVLHILTDKINENQLGHLLELRRELCQKKLEQYIEKPE